MRAIRVPQYGGPEVMRVEDLPDPTPTAGEVLVRIEAAGLNFIDIYHRTGAYKVPLPIPIGLEAAGVVAAVGRGVTTPRLGDHVAWTGTPGSYATLNVVPADRLVTLPPGIDVRTGAAAMMQGMTAHFLVRSAYALKPGDTCLVHAAAGGVGLLLCQMAKRVGARVIGTVSTEEKAKLAQEAGADDVILYTHQDFEAAVKRLTDGKGLQVVYDGVGKETFDRSLNCLAPRGCLVLYGQSSGPIPPVETLRLREKGSLYLTRPTLAHYTLSRDELVQRASDVFTWIHTGKLAIRIGATFPLAEAAEAHRQLEERRTTGKVLLIP